MSVDVGKGYEEAVASDLVNTGYTILARNLRTPYAEIDIIAKSNARIHFIEVKYRSSDSFGGAVSALSRNQSRRIERAANYWVCRNFPEADFQVDLAAVTKDQDQLKINYYLDISGTYS